MKVAGIMLIAIGALWIVMCFVGTAMMSRSVDFFSEAFLPSLAGFALASLGFWLMTRKRSDKVSD